MTNSLTTEEYDLLLRVGAKPELEAFFFRRLKGLKWLKELIAKGHYAPEKLPGPVKAAQEGFYSVPYWAPIGYLLTIAPEIKSQQSDADARIVLGIVRSVTTFAIEHKRHNYRVWWEFAKILSFMPATLVEDDDLGLVNYWLDDPFERAMVAEEVGKWVSELLKDPLAHAHELALKASELIFQLRKADDVDQEKSLRVEGWTAGRLIERLAPRLGETLHARGVAVFLSPLIALLRSKKGKRDSWSHMWRPAIEAHPQNVRGESPDHLLIDGFRDSADAFARANPNDTLPFLKAILKEKRGTPKRVAIYTLTQHFDTLHALLPDVLHQKYFSNNFRHEVWHLLKRCYPTFTLSEKQTVQCLIQACVVPNEAGDAVAAPTAYLQATWYSAIQDHGDTERAEYNKRVATAGSTPEHPDFSSYHTSGYLEHNSLYTAEELAALGPHDLAAQLQRYKPDDDAFLPEHDSRGLGKTLQQVLVAEPLKYFYHLDSFETLDLNFVHAVFEAFLELWSANGALPWEELWDHVLSFGEALTKSSSRLWQVEPDGNVLKANKHWIVGDIAKVIEQGTKSDNHVMPDALLPRAQTLLLSMLANAPGSSFKSEDDAIFTAINSSRGGCIEALFNLALRRCRLADLAGEHQTVWERELEPCFDAELASASTTSFEFAVLAVNYLPNLLYLSSAWVEKNLDRLFWVDDQTMWLCAMQGYAQLARVLRPLYEYLKRSGQFLKALDEPRLKERVHEKVIQNIAVGFIFDFENLECPDSLISTLLARGKRDEIGHLIWFVWTLRDPDSDERLSRKVEALWPLILNSLDVTTRDGRLLVSRLCTWLELISEITPQNLDWILAVAAYADENHNSYGFLQSLARLSERFPNQVFEIWKILLKGSRAAYPPEAITTIFKNLLLLGTEGKRKATEIASDYLQQENQGPYDSLRSLLNSQAK